MTWRLQQADLVLGGPYERSEQRMGRKWPGFQLRMVLHADEPGMVWDLDDLGQDAVGRHAREPQTHLLQPVLVIDVDLIAIAVALPDPALAVDALHPGATPQIRPVGAD